MSSAPGFDFETVARAALAQCQDLLPRWFPAGRFRGREFVIGDLRGTLGESLSINTQTGQWADFSTDDRGGDLISLFAAMHRIKQIEAATQLSDILGGVVQAQPRTAHVTPIRTPESPEWDGIFPMPEDTPAPPDRHPQHGTPTHIATYRNTAGQPIALVYRCEPSPGKKEVVPLTYCRNTRTERREWRWQSLPKPRSLYHAELLERFPDASVLLVEGEPKCDAANAILSETWICLSWPNGANSWKQADWSMLAGRDVTIWPDADPPGVAAAKQIADQLPHYRASARVLTPPPDAPSGWDIGDAIREGWDMSRLRDFLGENVPQIDDDPNILPITWFSDIQSVSDAKDFVQGLLIERGASVVYGESNAGKTFWATDLALHVAAGKIWNGRRIEQGAVIYCVLEGSMGFRNRVAAWRAEYADGSDIPFVAIECGINLLNPDADTPRLIATIKHVSTKLGVRVVLTVIDTLSRALAGGNENSPEDMGALVVNVDNIRAATNSHVMAIHHSGKDAAKGARGHSLLRAAIDTEIEVVAEEETARKTATVVKQRELAKGAVFEFSLSTIIVGQNRYHEDVTTCLVQHTGDPNAKPATRKQGGSTGRALEILVNLLANAGQAGFEGTPLNTPSVPETWWRERFYEQAMAGAEEDAKRKAFRRAADALVEKHVVGLGNRRVWVVRKRSSDNEAEPGTFVPPAGH